MLWTEPRSILHEFIDMGPMSWHVRGAMYTSFGVRGSYSFDPYHRRHGDMLNSYGAAGLTLMRLECGIVFTFSQGPWASDGWHGDFATPDFQ